MASPHRPQPANEARQRTNERYLKVRCDSLAKAFQLAPLIGLAATAVFYFAKRHYLGDIRASQG